ncbi:hypothetical protein DIPPA_34137 [Diplonema papillatum]|nr:hypothetical protein DIPPA_34137 [Diplonema papillatum]
MGMLSTEIGKHRTEWQPDQPAAAQHGRLGAGEATAELRGEFDAARPASDLYSGVKRREDSITLNTFTEGLEKMRAIQPPVHVPVSDDPEHQPGGTLGRVMSTMDTTAVPHRVVSLAELQVARKARGKQVDNEPFEERDSVTTTLSVPRRDEDFETMRNYDPRNGGEHYRTFAWHMSVVLVLLGFITTGVAGVTVYWRRDGCLLYKLLFLEGTTEACCGSRYLIPRFASFFGGRKTFYPGTPEPADASQQCTNVWDWEAGDAQTAHFFAIFFVFLSLSCRSGAIVAYLTGHQRRKNVYPWLTLACGLCGLLCLVGYSFAWSGRHLSAGPALWFVGLQMVVDFVAYCSTMSSTRLDQAGKRRAKIDVVMSAWHEMPRRVKFVFAFFLLGWLAIAGVIATPWIVSSRLCEDPAEAKAQGKCCKDYYVLFVRDSCGPAMSSFKLENVTWMAAHVMATILIAISVVFRALATYYGWRNPTLFPRRAIIAAWLMVLAVTVYGGLTTTTPERFTKVYVATVCYEAINLILLHLLYIKYHTQLWSPNFAERRRNPGWKDPLDNERPILVTKQRTRRIGFLGREFYRKDINSNGATGAPTVKEGSRATSPYRTSDVKRQTVGAPSPTYRHPTQNASNAVGQWQAGQQKYVLGEPIRLYPDSPTVGPTSPTIVPRDLQKGRVYPNAPSLLTPSVGLGYGGVVPDVLHSTSAGSRKIESFTWNPDGPVENPLVGVFAES